MRKIPLAPYKVKEQDFDVKESLLTIIFSPHLRLSARGLFDMNKIAEKIESASDGVVLLEDAEYQKVRNAVETFEGYERKDLEFVQRVLDAPEVWVKEA